jgi:hypothetical protein
MRRGELDVIEPHSFASLKIGRYTTGTISRLHVETEIRHMANLLKTKMTETLTAFPSDNEIESCRRANHSASTCSKPCLRDTSLTEPSNSTPSIIPKLNPSSSLPQPSLATPSRMSPYSSCIAEHARRYTIDRVSGQDAMGNSILDSMSIVRLWWRRMQRQ